MCHLPRFVTSSSISSIAVYEALQLSSPWHSLRAPSATFSAKPTRHCSPSRPPGISPTRFDQVTRCRHQPHPYPASCSPSVPATRHCSPLSPPGIVVHQIVLVKHVCRVHEHEAKFLIYCGQCSRSYTKLASFKKHIQHSSECRAFNQAAINEAASSSSETILLPAAEDADMQDLGSVVILEPGQEDLAPPPMKWRAAAFLLSIKEQQLSSPWHSLRAPSATFSAKPTRHCSPSRPPGISPTRFDQVTRCRHQPHPYPASCSPSVPATRHCSPLSPPGIVVHQIVLVKHVCRVHEHEAKFLIYCGQCSRSYTKLASFKKHIQHSSECRAFNQAAINEAASSSSETILLPAAEDADMQDLGSVVILEPGQEDLAPPPMKWRADAFLLSIKERHLLSQAAVDTMVPSSTSLVGGILDDVLAELRGALPNEALPVLEEKVEEGLFSLKPFEGLETAYFQKRYMRELFKLVVSFFVTS